MPIVKAFEALPPRPVVMVIYGEPGVCKTSLFNTCNEPLLIDADKGVDRSLFRKDTLIINSWDDIISEEAAGTFRNYKTIGIDTAKALLDDYLMSWVVSQDYKLKTNKLGAYGAMGDNFKVFVNNRRSESADIVIIAHAKKDEDSKKIIPDVTGQSYQLLMRIADQVGYVSIKNGKRTIQFEPSDITVGKNVACLQEIVIPDKSTAEFRTFGATLVEQVRTAIASMSEEQREALAKSDMYQTNIDGATEPEHLTGIVGEIMELPDYLKLPLRQVLSAKSKEMGWKWNKDLKQYEVDPAQKPSAIIYTTEAEVFTALGACTTDEDIAALYFNNAEMVSASEKLTVAFNAAREIFAQHSETENNGTAKADQKEVAHV